MASPRGTQQPRSNQPRHPDTVRNPLTSYVLDTRYTDEDRYSLERLETTQPYLLPWFTNPEFFDPRIGFPFEDTGAEAIYDGETVFPNSIPANQPFNTAKHDNSIAAPTTTVAGPNPSTVSTTSLQVHVQPQTPLATPGHKYRCIVCLKTFDRESRLENCLNRHFDVKPHGCFGACGSTGCPESYASIEHLNRHLNRVVLCSSCGKTRSKQNMARHLASCVGNE